MTDLLKLSGIVVSLVGDFWKLEFGILGSENNLQRGGDFLRVRFEI